MGGNKRDSLLVMILVLGSVAAFFGGALAFVNAHTQEVIEARMFKEQLLPTLREAFASLHPDNDFLEDKRTLFIGFDPMGREIHADIYVAQNNKEPLAVATVTDGLGYSGRITVLVAANVGNRQIISVKTLAQEETKGIGDRIGSDRDPFIQQFLGMRIDSDLRLSSQGGDIDAMSGATVTSAAFLKTVKSAAELLWGEIEKKEGK